jgi:signal peptidase I
MLDSLKSIFGAFWDFIEAIVFALAIFVVVYLFLFQPNQVKGNSMHPTFKDGQYIFTDKISYRMGTPKRGEVIVFKDPKNPDIDFIKRIIGMPGDTVKISEGRVYLNGQILDESNYLASDVFTGPESYLSENQELTVPEGFYFVMGDNRPHSSDSRDFGPVKPSDFVGKVFFRYWPVADFGKIDGAKYSL